MIYAIGKYRISAMPSGSSYIPVQKSAYPVLLALFTTIFVLSNIVSTKGVQVGPLVTDGAFFLFPAAYVIGDVISECYGFRAARRAVWTGFLAMIIAVSTFYVAILLPAASFYEGQAAFAVTLGLVPRIVVASLSGYAAGQLLNAWLLTLMKDRLGERGLWKRLLGSTVVGEFGDTLIFCLIAAPVIGISTVGDTANYVVVGFVWKTLVEVVVMPITYLVIRRIKAHE
ncbi:queuosine precursor transporter [Corynebacterium matruchotii]|uniref:Probable queuosine precursor transporter n=1 Tax=Corynebacterium matruchotii ATCC 33806 TaxID=566549 RepID=C0DZM8_9CORY|nr:queuosine precursor transporter [Corynebacterium matruchotii]EEG28345.1 putative membrane protein [Corynebacterium matruchotii ATCC 33806]